MQLTTHTHLHQETAKRASIHLDVSNPESKKQ